MKTRDGTQVTRVSVSMSVKLTHNYQSYGVAVAEEAEGGEQETKDVVKGLSQDVISNIKDIIKDFKQKNPTFAACVEKHKEVGRQFKKYQEAVAEESE
jgi:hypothetical protein